MRLLAPRAATSCSLSPNLILNGVSEKIRRIGSDWLSLTEQREIRRGRREHHAALGESHGVTILLSAGAARRFHKRIETELVLASLLPAPADAPPPDRDEVAKAAAHEAFAATYVFDWKVPTAA